MRRSLILVSVVVCVVALAIPAFAAKGGNGGNGGKGNKGEGKNDGSSLSLVLVTDVNSDGMANWGDEVSFDVSTAATSEPNVSLTCSQDGVVVYGAVTGYYDGYPWPWTQVMTLSSTLWSEGAADCVATLHYFKGSRTIELATLAFTAGA